MQTGGAGILEAPAVLPVEMMEPVLETRPLVTAGLFGDLHYAEKEPWRNRHYRDSRQKLRRCIDDFNRLKVDFAVHLGDLVDSDETIEADRRNLFGIESEYARFSGPRHYVFGNHCVQSFSKTELFENTGAQSETFYSFDSNGFHFVILDACFRSDGVSYERGNFDWTDSDIPVEEREWLRRDLAETPFPVIVFVHQRLDTDDRFGIRSAAAVRRIMEDSGKVRVVFQAHSHERDYRKIGGIHYLTLRAMVEGAGVENGSYGLLEIFADRTIRFRGFQREESRWFE